MGSYLSSLLARRQAGRIGVGDKTVRLWDAVTGAALQTLEGHSAGFLSGLLARRQAGRVRVAGQDGAGSGTP
jgi:hypothetical protein